ncbi:lysine--tRNA ligase [Halobacteriales archaeon QS_5_68_33]|nr:MAG: lysine--tRNA ligase [Halobacteriales archaeon QS_5_68_33]
MTEFDPADHFAPDRLEKLGRLREAGVDPYPPAFRPSRSVGGFVDEYEDIEEIEDDTTHRLAGRVHRINDLGGIAFVEIEDESGAVQLILDEDTDGYEHIDELDFIDIVGAEGEAVRSNTGELSLHADSFTFLTKTLKHHNPPSQSELGDRYETRAVKFWWGEVRDPVETRYRMTRQLRRFLDDCGFLEVETPVLQNVAGGTDATPFETHLEAKDQEMYLRIATELHLKRLLVGGFEKVYEVGPVFRNEDIDVTHNPEFTMLELYQAYADYTDMMDLTEDLVAHLVEAAAGDLVVTYDNPLRDADGNVRTDEENDVLTEPVEIDFSPPWPRMTPEEAIERYSDESIDVTECDDEELRELALAHGGEFPGGYSRGLGIVELFENVAEYEIVDPTFVVDHPKETTPLCKDHREKEGRIERFELFAAGFELANAYTELNDPVEQGELFAEQVARREAGDEEAHQMDEDFLDALAHGMPPAGGLGVGIDRLAMLATNSQTIKDVIAFPIRGE